MKRSLRAPAAILAAAILLATPVLAAAQEVQDELDETTGWLSGLLSGKGMFIAAVIAMIAVLVLAFRGSVALSLLVLGLVGIVAIILPTLKSAFGA